MTASRRPTNVSRLRGRSVARRFWLPIVAVLVATLSACTGAVADNAASSSSDPGSPPSTTDASPTATRAAQPAAVLDSSGRATPWPDRPIVQLNFDLTGWRTGVVTGTEDVKFTPDLKVCDEVFRLWPNKPKTAQAGDLLTVTTASIQGKNGQRGTVKPQFQTAGGKGGVPTLMQLPLASCVAPGIVITTHLEFSLKLGTDVGERLGRTSDGSYAWLGSAFPLLAWEHGAGWMRDPAVDVTGEMAGSEDFTLKSLDVTAPHDDQVQGIGQSVQESHPYGAPARYRYTADAVRDVLVTVGRFSVRDATVDGVVVHLATHLGMQASRWTWLDAAQKSLAELPSLLGPFPYPEVWLTVIDTQLSGGIEYPGAALLGDAKSDQVQALLTHELAHSYFYGLVGNDQGRDPWLDESFTTWAEIVVEHEPAPGPPPDAPDGKVGRPMDYWAQQPSPGRTFVESVNGWGALALTAARAKVGPKAFDPALRHYLDVNAHRIARPEDLAAAFAGLPAVLTILRNAGALPS